MFGQFFVLFGMIGVGYFCCRKKYLNEEMTLGLGNIVLMVTIPALLFSTLSNREIEQTMLNYFVFITIFQFLGMFVFGRILHVIYRLRNYDESHLNMMEVTGASTNNAFIGFPIAAMFLGSDGVVFMSASVLGLNLYVWSIGVYLIKGVKSGSLKETIALVVKGMLNPNISSIVLGLLFSLLGFTRFIPSFLQEFIDTIGSISTPLSLIYIGALTGNSGIRQLLRERDVLEASTIKMIMLPLFTFLVLLILPIAPFIKAVLFINLSLPSAAIVPMVVGRYGVGAEVSSKIVLVSTVISIVTLPICVTICNIWL